MNHAHKREPNRGLECPHCGCRHFYTTHTEPLRDGRIRRRKVCRHCGRKVVTYETVPHRSRSPDC
jgi:transcriptional regulator NrdR family protein